MIKNIILLSALTFAGISGASTERCIPHVPPHSVGRVLGFKCYGIGGQGKLAKAGLIDGDIILSVDGEALRNAIQAADLISRIRDGHQETLQPKLLNK